MMVVLLILLFVFFKPKAAYEIRLRSVGSGIVFRDSLPTALACGSGDASAVADGATGWCWCTRGVLLEHTAMRSDRTWMPGCGEIAP